jgi:hypothetical protein
MRNVAFPVLLLSLLAVPFAAQAAGQMKPGLWEMTIKSDAVKKMPAIPPEQLEQMRRLGVDIPHMTSDGIVTKVCISPAMAARDEPPVMSESNSGCKTRNYRHDGDSYTLDLACSGMLNGEGKAQGRFSGGEHFSSTYDFHGTVQGRPVNQHQETSGRWLGADCGDVKPADQLMRQK